MTFDFETDNLDCCAPDDLAEFCAARPEEFPPEFSAADIRRLQDYARIKYNAEQYRSVGMIRDAIELERQADRIYRGLPGRLKW